MKSIFLTSSVLLTGVPALPHQQRQSNGPVITSNFQDPSIIQVNDGTWYSYSGPNGNPAGINVQIATSPDFSFWQLVPNYEVLPSAGAWAADVPHVWAPDVNRLVSSFLRMRWLMY